MKFYFLFTALVAISLQSCAQSQPAKSEKDANFEYQKPEAEWKAELSPEAFYVLREKGTERAFTGKFNKFDDNGVFVCAGCENPLFSSKTKFESGTGWPSFYDIVGDTNVVAAPDNSHGWTRTEVLCGKCGGHLGHVFNDGPAPTGLRYCINSVSLGFEPR